MDLGRVLIAAILRLPLARFYLPAQIYLASLLEILRANLCQLAAGHDVQPFGVFSFLPGILVCPRLINSHGKRSN